MRRSALIAATVTLGLCVTAPPASADVAGTLCSLAGWVSGVASKVCTVARRAGGVINTGERLAGGGASKAVARAAGLAAVATAVVAGAHYALAETGKLVNATTTPNLRTPWFSASYWRMAAVSALITLPFLFAAAIQALLRSDLSLLARSAFGYLPLGMLAVGIAAPLTGLLLAASDEMSALVSSAAGHSSTTVLAQSSLVGVAAGISRSLFVAFFIALFTVAGAVTLWLELLIRQAAVYVIVLMLPLFFAAMVWPARRIWAIRAVELLVALILSKFAIVAVLSLGGAALGHTLIPGYQSLLAGTTLVLLAAFSPWAMLRLLPLHELAGAAAGGLRPVAGPRPAGAADQTHPLTDAGEDVAAQLPARLLSLMARNVVDHDDQSDPAGAAASRAVAPDGDSAHAEMPRAKGRPATAAWGEGQPAGGAGAPENGTGNPGWEPGDEPEMPPRPEDAFAGPPRHGPLPRVLQPRNRWRTLGLGARGHSDPPLHDEEVRAPDPQPEPEPEPGKGFELASAPEPDPGPAFGPASGPEPHPPAPLPDPAPEEDLR